MANPLQEGTQKDRNAAKDEIDVFLKNTDIDRSERLKVLTRRRDFVDGRHHKYTNVTGEYNKRIRGHILAVFNYIWKMTVKIYQALTNNPPQLSIEPEDNSDDTEIIRAEAVEDLVEAVLEDEDNKFKSNVFKRGGFTQVRDADFAVKCFVETTVRGERKIKIQLAERIENVYVGWMGDDLTQYDRVLHRFLAPLTWIKKEWGIDAEPVKPPEEGASVSSHEDQYGTKPQASETAGPPSGATKIPSAYVNDYWKFIYIGGNPEEGVLPIRKVLNVVKIGDKIPQYVVTDYPRLPWLIGRSIPNPGSPWSHSLIDVLMDPQTEFNDRSNEEGDMVRSGANLKYLAINMPDFDAESVKPGTQVIYIEGENAEFKALPISINPFPSQQYLNRIRDVMFDLGVPKVALASGTGQFTGKALTIQYQAMIDTVADLREAWDGVLTDLITLIQLYFIQFFPESHPIMRYLDPETMEESDPIIRKLKIEWNTILPTSRSENIVDAANLFDRGAISLYKFLQMSGEPDPEREIKRLKKEWQEEDLSVIRAKAYQLTTGFIAAMNRAQALTQQQQPEQVEQNVPEEGGGAAQGGQTPILNQGQNTRPQPSAAPGTGIAGTTSAQGRVAQVGQNIKAKEGVL